MTTSKIKIKLGAIEVEYEGSESFLKEELPALLTAVSDLYQRSTGGNGTNADVGNDSKGQSTGGPSAALPTQANGKTILGTTNTIAQRLQVKSGPDLLLAAAARLTIVENREVFTRQQLLDEMKTATAYVRSTYLTNLGRTLTNMVKDGTLNEARTGQFALSASRREELETRLA
ncbi:hypothetical protein [Paraburkholderia terricola]|jgi:hypothetical protein|uniref:hypothetical protein n=1 Tax=Paraburkholderia terricola TaxID=169427 RepID=UPI003ECFC712